MRSHGIFALRCTMTSHQPPTVSTTSARGVTSMSTGGVDGTSGAGGPDEVVRERVETGGGGDVGGDGGETGETGAAGAGAAGAGAATTRGGVSIPGELGARRSG